MGGSKLVKVYLKLFIDDSEDSRTAAVLLDEAGVPHKVWHLDRFNGVSNIRPPTLSAPEGTFESIDAIRSYVGSAACANHARHDGSD